MADYDRRPYRGGGRGGHFNNRKRRNRDNDHDDRQPQRRRYEEPLAITVRRAVLDLASSPKPMEEQVTFISKSLAENYFDSDLTSGFVDLVGKITIEQPARIPFIAAVVLTTNTQKPEFTPEILNKVSAALQRHVDAGEWREVKLYIRLLGCLQGMFEGDGIFPLLEQFFERAADLQMQSSEDSLGLELVKIILLSIPYTMTSSATGLESLASSLLEKTDVIASTPHALENLVDPLPSLSAGSNTSSESALALLQKHMQEEAKANWKVTCLPRPWVIERTEGEEDPLLAAQKHTFPEIKLPETIQVGPHPIYPEIYLSVYSDQEVATVPTSSDTSAIIIRDVVTDTINAMDFNRGETAKFLIAIDDYFGKDTFVKRGTAFDKIREVAGDHTLFKPEDVVVDGCFSLLFALPAPEHKLVYYHSILTEACKIAPAAVAPSLGRAIRFLYRNVERMDVELAHRFLDWFAHHLSNFGFTWKWTEWTGDIELNDVHPRKAFIIDSLDKEIRLSFAQRIKGTLPPEYAGLISEERQKDTPDFKFNPEGTLYATEAKEIAALIRKKGTKEDFQPLLETIRGEGDDLLAVDAFVTAICWVGSKSLSHLLACVERSKETLLAMRDEGKEAEKQIVKSILEFWSVSAGNGVMVLDKFLNYLVVSPEAVVESVLSGDGRVLARGWVWEAIDRVVGKVVGRIKGVVSALRKPDLDEEKKTEVKGVLEQEMQKMRSLFELIKQQVTGLNGGGGDMTGEEGELVLMWAGKWVRAWERCLAVEESWVREELAKPIPEVKVEEDKEGDVVMNGGSKEEAQNGDTEESAAKRMKTEEDAEMDAIE